MTSPNFQGLGIKIPAKTEVDCWRCLFKWWYSL